MTERTQQQLLVVSILAILGTLVGELLGAALLVTIGVAGFFAALGAALTVMTVQLIRGVRHSTVPDLSEPAIDDPVR